MEINNELFEFFKDEALDSLRAVEGILLGIRGNSWSEKNLSDVKRSLHNLKGTSNSLGLSTFGDFCHTFEDYIEKRESTGTPIDSKICIKAVDILMHYLVNPSSDLQRHKSVFEESSSQKAHKESLEAVGTRSTEELEAKQSNVVTTEDSLDVPESSSPQELSSEDAFIKCKTEKVDSLIDVFSELVTIQSSLMFLKKDYKNNENEICNAISQMDKITGDLQHSVLSLRMESLNKLYSILERSIFDASGRTGVAINVETSGRELELDRGIIKKLIDPLCHLVRNCVDHGLSEKEDNDATVTLKSYQKAGFFYFCISDNGAGIDVERLKVKAKEFGINTDGWNKQELVSLIFRSEFTTKNEASDLSGRGIGMNVVQEVIQDLKGTIEVGTELGVGTMFQIKLPISLSVFNGAVVSVNNCKYVIPNSEIKEIIDYRNVETTEVKQGHVVKIRESVLPILELSKVLPGRERSAKSAKSRPSLIIAQVFGGLIALEVENILHQQKVVGKNLGEEVSQVKYVSGATILSNGELVPILNVSKFRSLQEVASEAH